VDSLDRFINRMASESSSSIDGDDDEAGILELRRHGVCWRSGEKNDV
jgi:hypothetical protein